MVTPAAIANATAWVSSPANTASCRYEENKLIEQKKDLLYQIEHFDLEPADRELVTSKIETVRRRMLSLPYIPSVAFVAKELGRPKATAMVKAYLVGLNIALNTARPMTEMMIEQSAPIILDYMLSDEICADITVADLRLIFERITRGNYGKIYGGLGCQDICGFIDLYAQEKHEEYMRLMALNKAPDTHQRTATDAISMREAMHQAQAKYLVEKAKGANLADA